MSLTRRGYVVLGICLLALVLGATFGARSLNAIVVPGLVALAAGWIGVKRAESPDVTRSRLAPGFPGDVREVNLALDAKRTASATVRDTIGKGLSADADRIETGVPGRATYDCAFERRGEHTIGPVVLIVTDALGLTAREFRTGTTTDVLVYPSVHPLSGYAREVLLGGSGADLLDDRGEFDSLREYVPGDPLRDVNWKASAKRDSFVVTNFAADTEREGVVIAAEAAPGKADEMASAVASVACWLLERGIEIELATPDGRLSRTDASTRERLLATLARVGAGRVATESRKRADVVIAAEVGGTTISVGGDTHSFDRFVDRSGLEERTDPPRARIGPDSIGETAARRATTDGGIEVEATPENRP